MKPPADSKVEVDMVPLIDIISLLLMFLLVVGGTKVQADSIQMKLPRADQAVALVRDEGRIVVHMQNQSGTYRAVVNNKSYALVADGANKTLLERLESDLVSAARNERGAIVTPVKLRIPEDAPMREVEKLVMTLSRAGVTNIHYAAEPVR